ncbi:RNA polymerase subunit sigma-28 [Clostridium tagluense]|uniref:sigma factor n=1 Tax=Clostridium tagluense TaxID=360422 RepID=UPI001C0DA13A|nr:sigma factor [Clostridium tagluense]MBU3129266.1 RNA polymerase subunit sigma-28 [Clostridium tagluense]MCB2310245.1 RNA polymerase subunit sigma-28 [Clostridium tagluense]MCB2315113.1 RNA polymerase subunit sigma-28 [Clostridium tagluense]MCB2319945.1 RNA polymerase subunit sigma-28 [Clostridium tagluense]MCB2324856.1 RNA polymerase subunit sigma-28 [Clostridium tagluense]
MNLKLLFHKNKKTVSSLDEDQSFNIDALLPENRSNFIGANKGFIYSTTSKICKRNLIWENDEELSISLMAFNIACDKYDETKGNFYGFVKIIIKNALIDFFRKNKNSPNLIFDNNNGNVDYIDGKNSINNFEIQIENEFRADEIKLFSEELLKYKINFDSLINLSPSHKDTRNNLLNLAFLCAREESVLNHLKTKRRLPTKEIIILTASNRKLIEKWRIYIISLILILINPEYVYLKSYLNIKEGELND